jgi:hypothetical protein
MTRTERIPPNPNHYVGNHPLIHSDQLDLYYPEPEDSRPAFRSAFNDASFRKGPAHFQPRPFRQSSIAGAASFETSCSGSAYRMNFGGPDRTNSLTLFEPKYQLHVALIAVSIIEFNLDRKTKSIIIVNSESQISPE